MYLGQPQVTGSKNLDKKAQVDVDHHVFEFQPKENSLVYIYKEVKRLFKRGQG
jgi:hypothetical protein